MPLLRAQKVHFRLSLSDRRRVYGDKRLVFAIAMVMQFAGDQFFTGPTFTANQHG